MGMEYKQSLHGNNAKVRKDKKIVGTNITNAVTQTGAQKGEKPPVTNDLLVEQARDFSIENKK